MLTPKPKNIDDYMACFPEEIQAILQQVRETIHLTAPEAEEAIKYDMPAFTFHGNLVYFAAFKNHLGFYPAPTGVAEFEADLAQYKAGKGSVQFPFNKPLPIDLIKRIVLYRMQKNLAKSGHK